MIDYNTLRTLLQEMATDTPGQDGCAGCGYEHNCDTQGCAILRDVLATMEQLHRDVASRGCATCISVRKATDEEPCRSCHGDYAPLSNWQWRGVQAPDTPSPGACADQK